MLDSDAVLSRIFFILSFCFSILVDHILAFKKATATVNSDACSGKICPSVFLTKNSLFYEDVLRNLM